jgi:hypothetical protein
LDVRQAYFEWSRIGGTPLGFKLGRQQIYYGDQRIFGAGLWGNTGRYAWDAAMLQINTSQVWLDGWIGLPSQNRPETWPNREFKSPTALVVYAGVKKPPCRLEVFYAGKYDGSNQTVGEFGKGTLQSNSMGFQLQKQAGELLDFTASFVGLKI